MQLTHAARTSNKQRASMWMWDALAITHARGLGEGGLRKVVIKAAEVVAQHAHAGLADVVDIHVACHRHDTTELGGLAEGEGKGAHKREPGRSIAQINAKLADRVHLHRALERLVKAADVVV